MILHHTQHGWPSHPLHQPPTSTTHQHDVPAQQTTQYLSTGIKRKNLKKNNLVKKLEHIKLKMGGWVGTTRFTHLDYREWSETTCRYTRLYQMPCQLCLTTSLLALADGISHEGPRFFTLVQPRRTSIFIYYLFLFYTALTKERLKNIFVRFSLLTVSFFIFHFIYQDVDECSTGQHDCDVAERAICNNTHGSYLCHCRHGYCGEDGRHCKGKVASVQCEAVLLSKEPSSILIMQFSGLKNCNEHQKRLNY